MLFNGQNKKLRDARYFLKESREDIDEGISDTLGFFGRKLKKTFSKKESDQEFRDGSARILEMLVGNRMNEILNKLNKLEKRGELGAETIISASNHDGRKVSISSVDDLIKNNVATWSISLRSPTIGFRVSCIYESPKSGGEKQRYKIEYLNQSRINPKTGEDLPGEERKEEAEDEWEMKSKLEEYFKMLNEAIDQRLKKYKKRGEKPEEIKTKEDEKSHSEYRPPEMNMDSGGGLRVGGEPKPISWQDYYGSR